MALDWYVGDRVQVAPQREVTKLGTGVVIDVDAHPDGKAKALLVRFDDGPRAGVWYSAGTLRALKQAQPSVPSAPPPLLFPEFQGLLEEPRSERVLACDVVEACLCRDPDLAAALAHHVPDVADAPSRDALERLREWLGLPERPSVQNEVLGFRYAVGKSLGLSGAGPLLAMLCVEFVQRNQFSDRWGAWRWADARISAWEERVWARLPARARPQKAPLKPKTAAVRSPSSTVEWRVDANAVVLAGLCSDRGLAKRLADFANESGPHATRQSSLHWLRKRLELPLGPAHESEVLPYSRATASLLGLVKGPLLALVVQEAYENEYRKDAFEARQWARSRLSGWEAEWGKKIAALRRATPTTAAARAPSEEAQGSYTWRDVLDDGLCRSEDLARGLAVLVEANARGSTWDKQQWLVTWLGLKQDRSILSGKLPWTTKTANRLGMKRGLLLAQLSRRAEEQDFANRKEASDWAAGELEAWEHGVRHRLRESGPLGRFYREEWERLQRLLQPEG